MYVIILPREHMVYDFDFWTNWALYIHEHGVTNIYNNPFMVDYHPVFLYILGVFGAIQGSAFDIVQNMNYIKIVPLFFDFLPIIVFCGFRQKFIQKPIPFLLLLLNIAYLYNSMIWGQVDSIYVNIIFLAVIIGFYYPVFTAVLFAIALGTKLQAVIYLPLLVLVWIYSVQNIKTIIGIVISIILTLLIVALPFILTGHGEQLLHVVTSAVGRYPHVSVSGFNIWYLIYSGNPNHTVDTETYFLLSFKHWGLLAFFLLSGFTLLTVFFKIVRAKLSDAFDKEELIKTILLTGGLITLYFFYFNTQMHERYSHAMLIFFFFYGVFSKNYKLYFLCSIPYFLSLEKSFPDYLDIVHFKILFASKVIAIWYTITIGYAMYLFFKEHKLGNEYRLLKAAWNKRNVN